MMKPSGFIMQQLYKWSSLCGKCLSHIDFLYGRKLNFLGCVLLITQTGVDMLTEQHRSKKMAKQRISKGA